MTFSMVFRFSNRTFVLLVRVIWIQYDFRFNFLLEVGRIFLQDTETFPHRLHKLKIYMESGGFF